jgi:hypothetical protein
MAATRSIESSYFHSISTDFNKPQNPVRDHGVGGSNPLSPTNIFNELRIIDPDHLGVGQVPECWKVRQHWVSRRVLGARPSTKTSTVRRYDPVLDPDRETGYATHLSDLTADWCFGEGQLIPE